MPHIGEANIGGNWINLVTHFTPNLVTGTKYRIGIIYQFRGGEYIRQAGESRQRVEKARRAAERCQGNRGRSRALAFGLEA